jgi:hypothetical protein
MKKKFFFFFKNIFYLKYLNDLLKNLKYLSKFKIF